MSDIPLEQRLGEAYRRGILPPDMRSRYEEAVRRGLFAAPQAQEAPAQPAADPAAATDPAPTDMKALAAPPSPDALRQMQTAPASQAKQMEDRSRALQGYEPGVDYDTGTGWNDAVAMKRSSNPAEKKAYLTNRYGAENVFADKRGEHYVRTPEGLRSPSGTGFVNSLMGGAAGLAADSPMIAGSAAGAIAGAPFLPPLGPFIGAGLGALGGYGVREATKAASPLVGGDERFAKSPLETLKEAAGETAMGVVGEGAGQIITRAPRVLGDFFRKRIAGVTPETQDLTGAVLRSGGVPPLRSAAPSLSAASQTQDIATRLGSDFTEGRNRAAVHGRVTDILDSLGMSPAQREAVFDPTARVSSREAGVPIIAEVRGEAAALEGGVENLMRDADKILTGQLARLNAQSRRSPPGPLAEDVAGGIAQARSDFSTAMQKGYAQIDRMTGDAPVVPMFQVQKRAHQILQSLPKDATGEPIFGDARVLRSLRQLADTEAAMPLGQAKAIRSTLGDFGELTDLTPGVAKRQFDELRRAADAAIGQAALDPAVAPAIRLLRTMDKTYADGVRKFGDAEINAIVRQAKTGVHPDPSVIAAKVLAPGQQARAATIRDMVGPDVWRRVAAADWENVMARAIDQQTGEVSARRLATVIGERNRGGLLDLTYGPSLAKDMRLYSQRMDARGGKIPADTLTPDNFGQTMRRLETAQAQRDAFLSKNYLSELAKAGPMADDAVGFILRPGQETRLIEAQRFFGDTSPQIAAIRQQAISELLNSAIVRTETGASTTIAGTGIEKALSRWTSKQQDILFPGGLANDMRRLAQEIRFMFPAKQDSLAGGLIAGGIKVLPFPARVVASMPFEAMAWIYSRPSVVRTLAGGLKPGPAKEATRETIRLLARAAATGSLPEDEPEAQPGVLSPSDAAMQAIRERYGAASPGAAPADLSKRQPMAGPKMQQRPQGLRHSTGAE